jgi:hypothetical protein
VASYGWQATERAVALEGEGEIGAVDLAVAA